MLKIELFNAEGEKVTYTEPFVSLKHMKLATSYLSRIEEGLETVEDAFDEAIALVASFFKDENVTYDAIVEGLVPDDFQAVIMDLIYKVVDGETKKKGKATRTTIIEMAQKEAQEKMKEIKEPKKNNPKLSE